MSLDGYRFGFQNQEKDNEVKGEGNSYTAEFWQYSPRNGMRWNIDPVVKPFESSYASFGNNPIWRVDPNGDDWYKRIVTDTDGNQSQEHKWFEGEGDQEGWNHIGNYYISKSEDGKEMISHDGPTDEIHYALNNGRLDMVMEPGGNGAFRFNDASFILSNVYGMNGGASDFNYLTERLGEAGVKFGTLVLVGHGSYDYSSDRFMNIGSGRFTLSEEKLANLKGTNFAKAFDSGSNLILYQCSGARATKSGLEQDKFVYGLLSKSLGGANIYVSYGAVIPNPFVNGGNTTGNSRSAESYFRDMGINIKGDIKSIVNHNDLWLKVQQDSSNHLYGFKLNLNNSYLNITDGVNKPAKHTNFN